MTHLMIEAPGLWDLISARAAATPDAQMVVAATESLLNAFGTALVRYERGAPSRCPKGSWRLRAASVRKLTVVPFVS